MIPTATTSLKGLYKHHTVQEILNLNPITLTKAKMMTWCKETINKENERMWNHTIAMVLVFIPAQYVPPIWDNSMPKDTLHNQVGASIYPSSHIISFNANPLGDTSYTVLWFNYRWQDDRTREEGHSSQCRSQGRCYENFQNNNKAVDM